ncbi:MAG TPA: multicopper oxidase domain-containing protein [Blastocatellia bacterium]|jgi:FtsP/CotA-like multicopper oxidase with cupredoxin domain|nr:multicopper oxidase domain-containing protein [Blastocatellia bacterium]
MKEANDMKVQHVDKNKAAPASNEQKARAARRQFLRQALVVTSGVALSELLPSSVSEAVAQTCPPAGANDFMAVGEITSQGNKLQAVIRVVSGNRNVPTQTTPMMLRYFTGYNKAKPGEKWPTNPSAAGPGPTLRCEIGDVVQITLLNHVKVQDFAGSLDSGEEGRNNGCDQTTKANPDGTTDKNWYPANDKYPNCFHGSSSANLHFHGTHVTPSTTGDNILVNVRPNPKVTEQSVERWFSQIFEHCELGRQPQKWGDLPQGWRDDQARLLDEYDKTAPYVGPGRNANGHGLPGPPKYPQELRLLPQNEAAIAQGVWPQWFIGSYPYCFQIPRYREDAQGNPIGVKMGQAPGTHWYHSHKHGSTSINLFNGLAGALIITDNSPTGYDGKLKAFYNSTGNRLEEVVLVFQQFTEEPNLRSAAAPGKGPQVLINGQLTPTITMKPNEIKLFRMINATVQGFINAQFKSTQTPAPPANIQVRQTAQDGVQLAWANYSNSRNGTQPISMAPANRVDFLVQAPATQGCYVLQDTGLGPLLYVNVSGTAVRSPMVFPTQEADFPTMPNFLKDIDAGTVRLRREVSYNSKAGTAITPGGRALRQFTIDGKQFEDQVIDQVMLLDTAEEWTLYNFDTATGIAHPFHIHINPFQIFEVFNPNTMTAPQKLSAPFVWWDTFAIPPGKVVNGTVVPGYFKMRSRFVDFTGLYVQHCHILAHEDRGMMQLLQVVPNKTIIKHH